MYNISNIQQRYVTTGFTLLCYTYLFVYFNIVSTHVYENQGEWCVYGGGVRWVVVDDRERGYNSHNPQQVINISYNTRNRRVHCIIAHTEM